MKKMLLAGLFAATLFAAPAITAHAQAPFEGTITWSVQTPQMDEEKHDMVINIKGKKSEIEVDMGMMGSVKIWTDKEAKKTWVYNKSLNMGIVAEDKPESKSAPSTGGELKSTGNKATIAGRTAEEFVINTPDAEIHVWASADFPAEIRESMKGAMQNAAGKGGEQAFAQLAAKGLVPVKIVIIKEGDAFMTMEMKSFEKKTLADALFDLPAGVKFNAPPTMGKN